jgi:hypothetical protein
MIRDIYTLDLFGKYLGVGKKLSKTGITFGRRAMRKYPRELFTMSIWPIE